MLTLTTTIYANEAVATAIDHARSQLAALSNSAVGVPAITDQIAKLGDKQLNILRAGIVENVSADLWYVVDGTAFEALKVVYKTKDKIEVRRNALRTWFTSELTAINDLIELVERAREEAEAVRAQAAKDAAAAKSAAKAVAKAAMKSKAEIKIVSAEEIERFRVAAEAAGVAPELIERVALESSGGRAARTPRAPKAPKETTPRDKYDGMTIEQLLVEVETMFPGLNTTVRNESTLRYKLRRAEKMIAAGNKPLFNVTTASAPRISISVERAQLIVDKFNAFYRDGHILDAQTDLLVGELKDAIAKHAAPAVVVSSETVESSSDIDPDGHSMSENLDKLIAQHEEAV